MTIVEIEGPRVIVKAISGNLHLGGQDFDKNLLDYVIETFKTETGVDLTADTKKKVLKRVRAAVVRAKEALSFRENAFVHVGFGIFLVYVRRGSILGRGSPRRTGSAHQADQGRHESLERRFAQRNDASR